MSAVPFEDSVLYDILVNAAVDAVAQRLREAVFTEKEDVHQICEDTGMSLQHFMILCEEF